MTAICGGGPSQSRPGFDGGVNYAASAIGVVISKFIPQPAAGIIAAVVAQDVSDLTTFCNTDPPDDPDVTAADYLAILNPAALDDYVVARNKWMQWWEHVNWYNACMCSTGTTPPLGTVSTPGPSVQNPGLPGGDSNASCWDASTGFTAPVVSNATSGFGNANAVLPGSTTVVVNAWHTGGLAEAKTMPTGVLRMLLAVDADGTGPGPTVVVAFFNASGNVVNATSLLVDYSSGTTSGHKQQAFATVPSGSVSWNCEVMPYWGGPTDLQGSQYSGSIEFSYACSANTNQPITPCCPPDESTEFRLNQILTLVTNMAVQLAGLGVEATWVTGPAHAGCAGNGSIAIGSDVLAIKVDMTTTPSQVGDVIGSPTFYFEAGWITLTTDDGSYSSNKLIYDPQVFTVPLMTTQVDFTLEHGVIVTITELVRFVP